MQGQQTLSGEEHGPKGAELRRVALAAQCCAMAYQVVYEKFAQCPQLQAILMDTGHRVLAETIHKDAIWGTGVSMNDPRAHNRSQWLGTNILGGALMEVRKALR